MTITIHELLIDTAVQMLGTLSHLLDKAAEHAAARKFEVSALVHARLAPDMFPLATQIYLACQQARDGVARLTGQAPVATERVAEDFEQLRARIRATVAYLQEVPRTAFDGAEQRAITITVNPQLALTMTGLEMLRDWTLPHLYFHVVTAYDILRAAGVEIGKRDYVPHVARYVRAV